MNTQTNISFEDTAVAFSYKSDAALKKAHFIFSLVNHPWISSLATGAVKISLQLHLPIEGIIRNTAFVHFCGGESIEKSEAVIQQLGKYNVGTILDYSVEGEDTEADFDHTMHEILHTIEKAKHSKNINFSVFKVTGIAAAWLLQKIQEKQALTPDEARAWTNVQNRVDTICSAASINNLSVLIDAEETWLQDPIDALARRMMERYNTHRAIVFNTYQMYRTDAPGNLHEDLQRAREGRYYLGAKLVRGAYMEKERERADEAGYESPIHPSKEATDKAFNDALAFCIKNIDHLAVMCGSHNEYSNQFLVSLIRQNNLMHDDPRIWFAQLYGMSDNISFNLAKAGYHVVKYVPYGPVRSVMPYLFRRAEENTSVAGQSSRELTLIKKELRRRRNSS